MDKKGKIYLITEDEELIQLCKKFAFQQSCEFKVQSPESFSETQIFPLPKKDLEELRALEHEEKTEIKEKTKTKIAQTNIVPFPQKRIVSLKNLQRLHIKRYLELFDDDITALSKKLGISRSTFYRRFGKRKKLKKVA